MAALVSVTAKELGGLLAEQRLGISGYVWPNGSGYCPFCHASPGGKRPLPRARKPSPGDTLKFCTSQWLYVVAP